ncbi:MAG TPA: NAD(P)/FAD-dependent oxidoreductase [Chloroflexia bacterium]|nr:NAD(P)/FAD-dependent oxidoreductase [Chloroflexia bacterium]
MGEKRYDLLVIGAGAAGSTAASTAAGNGARVALVEDDKLGGTCLNYGCDPTKTLLSVARRLYEARHSERFGLHIDNARVEWKDVLCHVNGVIEKIRGGTPQEARESIERQGIDLIFGEARFLSPHEVAVAGRRIETNRVIIATGTESVEHPVSGLGEVGFITNKEAVSLPVLPERLAIIGGGPIGIEFAQLFGRFGVQVVVLQRSPTLLSGEDTELANILCELLSREGIRMMTGAELHCLPEGSGDKRLHVHTKQGGDEDIVVDEILVAVGRRPRTRSLGLEAAGVATLNDAVVVDRMLRTNVSHIWAAGDVTGGYRFTHVASDQGELAARNAFAEEPEPYDPGAIPWVTFTSPELAHVGKTEAQLVRDGIPHRVARMPLEKLDRARAEGETTGLVKLLAGEDGQILGCHILAPHAGDLIAPVVVAMKAGMTVDTLGKTVLPYPTMAEAVRWAADQLKAKAN